MVSGTSVVATILPSSIGHAIPGASSAAGKSMLLYGSVF